MKQLPICILLLFLLLISKSSDSANILGVAPVPQKSHTMLFHRLIIGLAEAGHNLTFLSHFQISKNKITNLQEIYLPFTTEKAFDTLNVDLFELRHLTAYDMILTGCKYGLVISENQLKSKEIKHLLQSNSTFDIILIETFAAESLSAALSYRFKAPLISYMNSQPNVWSNYLVGNEAPTSYIPNDFLGFSARMSFFQRLYNVFINGFANFYIQNVYLPKQEKLFKDVFADTPPLIDILKNTSLVFLSDHFSLTFARPMVPNMIPIAGVHVQPLKELPYDLKRYLDNANEGAVLFSLGSNLKSSAMSSEYIEMFKTVFKKLPEKVLWKYETEMLNIPSNVLISKWLPQSDILGHKNLKLFITHGGWLSTTESAYRGVPIIGIPIFGDQPMNMKNFVSLGMGLALQFDKLTEDMLFQAIRNVIDNSKYREATQKVSVLLKDQPMNALETAIWWIEYIIRHKGAPHLKSSARTLKWYQRHNVDVFAVFALIITFISFLIVRLLQFINTMFNSYGVNDEKEKKLSYNKRKISLKVAQSLKGYNISRG